jgi:selenocysteine-specific elongation factor
MSSPNRRGIPRDDLRQRVGLSEPTGAFEAVLAGLIADGKLSDEGATIRRADFVISIPITQQAAVERWIAAIEASPFAPPAPADFSIEAGVQLALAERGEVIRAAEGVFLTPGTLTTIETAVVELLQEKQRITLADVRDRFGTSRKYAQAMLELLDARKVTRRIGDERILLPGRKSLISGAAG